MATNSFQQQDSARRKSFQLVVYFVLAILILIALVYGLLVALSMYGAHEPVSWWQPDMLLIAAPGVGIVVGGASAIKVAQLASGGQAVALMLGGKEVPGTTTDAREKRLLNVVEEMALAAGVPVPPVYVLPETGINAFAAGYAPGDAVVAVSQGCLDYLTRDELQGVVAHEFSHILNGDMRLNIRLMGLIFGIMVLSIIGRSLMFASRGRASGRQDSRGGMVLLGLGVFMLGLVGAFFGRLIMAAVSRQREYLADASAVQFTRNPDGIGGALKKIGGLAEGSRVDTPRAAEVGHMFFANAFAGEGLAGLLATHPPLVERIRRLNPQFDGQFPEVRPVGVDREELEDRRPSRVPPFAGVPTLPGLPQVPMPVLGLASNPASRVGHIDPEVIDYARELHDSMPEVLRVAAQEPFSARALVYALLMDPRADLRELQLTQLRAGAEPQDFTEASRLVVPVQALPDTHRLPLLDLALPALRQMSPDQHRAFRAQVEMLMNADQRLSLYEYTLRCVLHRHLDAQFLPQRQTRPLHSSPQKLAQPVATVLALLAWEGQPEPDRAARAFDTGMRGYIGGDHTHRLPPPEKRSLIEFDAALRTLNQSVPAIKRRIVAACAACILADHQVTVREAELLRAVCDTLDCPLPPLVASESERR
ncbi:MULTISPECIES: M48 family metallopeptidase [unclassified Paraburkholderia]|uniref:M48 family metallopeptidase n=1 Tax=unclassified Paraburkholderia TaxID=2615204 RepID=UPI00161ADBD1|nr:MULTISPECIES: M48 family metallopeptidase [unclassified Paraburkholderia]MBB5448115.1 Zn-dependent protease with chaperone function [Paraburkholderia sp. WSM4177]MBB5488505.1 Zn-dependent protease with chaperone function [Paraburkholderia sp. WSM4180]